MKKTAVYQKLAALLFFIFFTSFIIAQPSSWQSRGIGGGGALFFPTINPANDNEFYIACDMSQLFHSTDFGVSYTQVQFTQLQVGNKTTYEFTNNNNIAYSLANDGNIHYGVRTLNAGNTWSSLPGNPLNEEVYALKADYDIPGRLVIGYYGSLYISNDTGKTFSLIKNAANAGAGITIAGIFFDNNNIYIGTNEGILYSSNGGSSFSIVSTIGIPAGQCIFSFAGAKAGGITRFFCVSANSADVYNGLPPYEYANLAKGVYSLDAGVNTWTSKMNGITTTNDFVMYVSMARNDINTVYLGGSDASTGGNLVMKTINAGNNWSKVFLTTNNQNIRTGWSGHGGDRSWGYGESCFGITVAPNNVNKVLFGDFGFVHKTSDGGANWQQAYVNAADENNAGAPTPQKRYYRSIGIENTTTWQLHWQDANNMFACFSDIRGIRSTNAGVSWSFDYTGHTANSMYRIAKHISNNTMFAGTSNVHDIYQSTYLQDSRLDVNDANGKIIYSTNNGAAWQLLRQFNHPVFWLATDPNNANRMYASVIHYAGGTGDGGIWMTNDLNNLGNSLWTKLPAPPRTQGHPAAIVVLNDGKMVCTFSGRRTSAGVFTASSGVFMYDPIANTWSDVSHADMHYWTKDIIIDPSDPTQNTWYVCVFSGWGGAPNGKGGLYRTTNRGASWTKLTGTQFDRVTSITFNPFVASQAYLTTEGQGLWISNDMNVAIPTWTFVNSYPFRQPERVFFNPHNGNEVWVTSFGNGLKVGQLSGPLPVTLVSFSGNRKNNSTSLQWSTNNEENGDRFEIERSIDAVHFEKIGTIPANRNTVNQYRFIDDFTATALYYRIKIITATGRMFYSNIIAFKNNHVFTDVLLLGNPVTTNITLQATVLKADQLQLTLVDLSGKIVLKQQSFVNTGVNQLHIPLPASCNSGTYVLQLRSNEVNKNINIVVVK